jgi:carbonic anhydrase
MDWVDRFRRTIDEPLPAPTTSDEVVTRLLAGNARFVCVAAPHVPAGSTVPPADPVAVAGPAAPVPTQAPFCAVLGCSDARVPSELVFEAGPNELFVVRVAGNVLGDECLGSIEYALHNFRDTLRLLVVLGHTGCGAVAATVDAYLSPTGRNSAAFTRSLRAVVNHVLMAVRGGAMSLEECWGAGVAADPGYRAALVEVSVYLNAAMTAYNLREEVRSAEAHGVRTVFGVFDLATCRVIGPDLDPATDDTGKLAPAPNDPDELVALGRQIAASPMVARHLSDALRKTKNPADGRT